MSDLIGQQRGNYRLTQLLGQGGFAEVYLGEHIHLGTKAAIKVLYTSLKKEGLEQFAREAKTLSNLAHPHIIKILDFGYDNSNIPYLVMEFAPGGTLSQRHPLNTLVPITTTVQYIKQIAEALQYAHTNKIIHRDIKPENMLLAQNNTLLLSDFGIARVVETYGIGTSHIAGSFQYMAPEQGAAKAVFASDQYSLGIVAYQWLCGTLPFHGSTTELMVQQRFEAPPPFPSQLHIPSSVENVVMKALSKDPQQRFATIQEFAYMLEQASKGRAFQAQQLAPTQVYNQAATVVSPPYSPVLQPTQIAPAQDSDALYRQGVEAYAKGDLDTTEQLWQQVLTLNPNYGNGMLTTRMKKLQQELQPIRIQRLRDRALTHYKAGEWQQEIEAWTQLLVTLPSDEQALERRKLAEHNKQFAWMYTTAQQFVREGKLDAAKTELTNLWHDAPYYGDPAGLARKAGLRPPVDYEQAKITQQKQQNAQAQERQRQRLLEDQQQQKQRLLEDQQELQERKKRAHKAWLDVFGGKIFMIWLCLFLFVSGVGMLVGLIAGYWTSQAWLIAVVTSVILAPLAYALGYRKVITPLSMLLPSLLAIATTLAVTWYTSHLNYSASEVSHIWSIERTLWIGRQLTFGIVIGLAAFLACIMIAASNDEL